MRYCLFTLFILIITSITGAAQSIEIDPLLKFIEIAAQENHPLERWEVTRKETFPKRNRKAFMNKFRMYERISMIKDENSLNYLFEDKSLANEEMIIQYKVVIPTNNAAEIEVSATLIGQKWDESTAFAYEQTMKKMDEKLFSKASKTFTCIVLQIDDTIESRVIINPFVSELEINRMDVQKDNVQNSTIKSIIYGYTPLWDNFFTIAGEPLNLHIAITELKNQKLSYKIGTPLLINEY